jgi:hypothetical protein
MKLKLAICTVAALVLCLAPISARADYQRNFGHLGNYGQSSTTTITLVTPSTNRRVYRPSARRHYRRPTRYGYRSYRRCYRPYYYRPVARTVWVFDPWLGWHTVVVYY